jgi:protein-glutamine gamma-glutamyltransferase
MTQSAVGFALSAVYAVVGTWWLFGASWQRLNLQAASETRREVPRSIAVSLAAAVLLVSLGGTLLGTSTSVQALAGFFPTSGGRDEYDDFAMRGLNDGDALVGATEEAASFGPVESELFLDSDMPSLYDMFSDTYGEPRKPERSEKAVAIDQKDSIDSHNEMATSQQANREFSTVRHPNRRHHSHKRQRDLASAALLYVKGRVPLHLRLEAYDQFDGRVWAKSSSLVSDLTLRLDRSNGKPWIRLAGSSPPTTADSSTSHERHGLRIINLKTTQIPSPIEIRGLHIDQVDRLDLFGIDGSGQLYMPERDHIPQLQVLHVESLVTDPASLRQAQFGDWATEGSMQPYLAMPRAANVQAIEALARHWTADVPRGWPQVEAIVAHLREDYSVDSSLVTGGDVSDVVSEFLFETRRGPDYQFASAAAILLRALGYPTRLATGLYASQDNYDRQAKQTAVLGADVHVWAEVSLDGETWCTVEPTPGYQVLQPQRGIVDLLAALPNHVRRWLADHFWLAAAVITLLALAVAFRRDLVELVCTAVWATSLLRSPRSQIEATVWLLDRRARLAGSVRPPRATLRHWYGDIAGRCDEPTRRSLDQLLDCAMRFLYSPGHSESSLGEARTVRNLCLSVAVYFHWRRFPRPVLHTSSQSVAMHVAQPAT